MDKHSYLERLLSIICSVFDAYTVVLFQQDRRSGEHVLTASFSLGDHVQRGAVAQPGKGFVGWILRNNQPLLINNVDRKKGKLGYYQLDEEAAVKAFMGCPLKRGEGAVCLDSKRTFCFSEKDQKILHLFADFLQDIDERFELAQASQGQHQYYHTLQVVHAMRTRIKSWNEFLTGLLALTSDVCGFEHTFLAVRTPEGGAYVIEGAHNPLLDKSHGPLDLNMGLVGWVFRHGQTLHQGEGETSGGPITPLFGKHSRNPAMRSTLLLPLVFSGGVRGVLGLASPHSRYIDEDLRVFSAMLADQLALFLENLHLKSKLQESSAKTRELLARSNHLSGAAPA